MKNTYLMLGVLGTLLITWLSLGLMHYLLSDVLYKESLLSNPVLAGMILIGWVPSVIVGVDLDKYLE